MKWTLCHLMCQPIRWSTEAMTADGNDMSQWASMQAAHLNYGDNASPKTPLKCCLTLITMTSCTGVKNVSPYL